MKILVVTEWYPTEKDLSHGLFVQRMVSSVIQNYKDVEVVLVHPQSSTEVSQVELIVKQNEGYTAISAKYPRRKTTLAKFFCYREAMKQAVTKAESIMGDIDLTWCQVAWRSALVGYYLQDKRGIPFVISEHWTGYSDFDGRYDTLPYILRKWQARLFAKADAVVGVSASQLQDISDKFQLDNAVVIGNVVPAIENELPKFDNFTFIHISTLSYQKNIPLMLDSFALLHRDHPFCRLLVVGGDEKSRAILKSDIKKKKLEGAVISMANVEQAKLQKLLNQSHALLHTSRFESFSVVVAESWSAGNPVVATACGGLTDGIPDFAGRSISRHTPEAVADGLVEVVANYSDFDSAKIKCLAEPFLSKNIAKEYYQLFISILTS